MWYTIKSGDTLSALAKTYLKDLNLWQQIADANKDVISNPNVLSVGTKIWIPVGGVASNVSPINVAIDSNKLMIYAGIAMLGLAGLMIMKKGKAQSRA